MSGSPPQISLARAVASTAPPRVDFLAVAIAHAVERLLRSSKDVLTVQLVARSIPALAGDRELIEHYAREALKRNGWIEVQGTRSGLLYFLRPTAATSTRARASDSPRFNYCSGADIGISWRFKGLRR